MHKVSSSGPTDWSLKEFLKDASHATDKDLRLKMLRFGHRSYGPEWPNALPYMDTAATSVSPVKGRISFRLNNKLPWCSLAGKWSCTGQCYTTPPPDGQIESNVKSVKTWILSHCLIWGRSKESIAADIISMHAKLMSVKKKILMMLLLQACLHFTHWPGENTYWR